MSSRTVLLLITLFISVICEEISFQNVPVKAKNVAKGLLKVDPVTGNLDPSKGLELANDVRVTGEKVTTLYKGAVNNLLRLYDLDLSHNEIEDIKPGAFQNLPKVLELQLNGNKLSTIKGDVFNGLNIKRLNLASNKISVIEETAFNDLPNLRVLLLDYNEVKKWNPNWFQKTPRLLMLHFSNNLLESLPGGAFKNIHGVENLDDGWSPPENYFDFSKNKISYIDPKAFEGVKQLEILDLRENQISHLLPGVFSTIEKAHSIWLINNKITCVSDEFLDSLPHGHGIAKRTYKFDSNPWNCTCLEKVQTWSKEKGSKVSSLGASVNCLVEKIKHL